VVFTHALKTVKNFIAIFLQSFEKIVTKINKSQPGRVLIRSATTFAKID
jgi:hypothetical protein